MNRTAGKWQAIVLTTLIITAAVFVVSVFLQPLYKSEARILISCKAPAKADFCTSQAADHIGEIFSKAAATSSFFSELEESDRPFAEDLPKQPDKAKDFWQHRIEVSNEGSGIVHVVSYDGSRKNAENLLMAVIETLQKNAAKYFPEADSIAVTTIDGPIIYSHPAKPNVLANTLRGFAIGLVISILSFFIWDKRSAKRLEADDLSARTWSPINFSEQFGERKPRPIFKNEDVYPIVKKEEEAESKKRNIFSTIPTFKVLDRKDAPVSQPEKEVEPVVKPAPEAAEKPKPETGIGKQTANLVKPLSTVQFVPRRETKKPDEKIEKKETAKGDQLAVISPRPVAKEAPKPIAETPSKLISKEPKQIAYERKAAAPDNLPIFEGDPDTAWKTPVAAPIGPTAPVAEKPVIERKVEKAEEKPAVAVERKEVSVLKAAAKEKTPDKPDEKTLVEIKEEREPTEEEIKQRLNKLLRGEL